MYKNKELTVGLFDSGVGGLFILKELIPFFPDIKWFYFADTQHWPYGNKTQKELSTYCLDIFKFLSSLSLDAIVIACNTASSLFVHQTHYTHIPLLNVIQPNCKSTIDFVKQTNKKKIGVIGTPWTIQSNIYKKTLLELYPTLNIFQQSTPRLTYCAEKKKITDPQCQTILKEELQFFIEQNIDALILGCTHYLYFKNTIAQIFSSSTALIDSINVLAENLKTILPAQTKVDTKSKIAPSKNIFLFVNQSSLNFTKKSREILQKPDLEPKIVSVQ